MSMKKANWLSCAEVGKRLSFSPRTISRWCREGKFENGARKVGRVWRIDERWVETLE